MKRYTYWFKHLKKVYAVPVFLALSISGFNILLQGCSWFSGTQVIDKTMAQLAAESGFGGGLIVHAGCGTGEGTMELEGSGFIVQGLDTDYVRIDLARQNVMQLDHDGTLTFRHWSGGSLPYTDNMINIFFWETRNNKADMVEIKRVLAPNGIAYIKKGKGWKKVVKPWPKEIDEWSHFRYNAGNTGASRDRKVGPPNHIQWEAGPRFMRSHEIETGLSAIVSSKGRLYYILDEGPTGITDNRFPDRWSLVCRDAFNGILLWKRPMPHWGWRAWNVERENTPLSWHATRHHFPVEIDRLMVAHDDTLFVTLGYGSSLSAIDGITGEVLKTYEETGGMLEFIFADGILITRDNKSGPAITAIQASDGKILWRTVAGRIMDRSLCAAGGQVFFHTRGEIISVNLKTGKELWRKETELMPSALIAHEDVVIVVQASLTLAFCSQTGAELWKGPGTRVRGRNPDIFMIDSLIHWGRPHFETRHIKTGITLRKADLKKVLESGHHRRCYTDRATINYMITGERGSEFLDLHENNHKRHNWLRGPCVTGMVPANGLFYVPPHQCFCYPAVRMDGFFALAHKLEGPISINGKNDNHRLYKGPAYAQSLKEYETNESNEWHTYRRDARRSGSTVSPVTPDLNKLWSKSLGGNLTQPLVAGKRVYAVNKDAGILHCLDIENGNLLWSKTVSGRIDSPPSYYNGFLFFGSRDGFIYSIRATDGELAWSFRAAPSERQIISYERLESAWPAHGSVLILNGLVYCTAGRSGFTDGGIYLYALDPLTGVPVYQNRLEGPYPDISQPSYAFHKEGHRSDLLSTDGSYLYMGRTALDRNLEVIETEPVHLTGNQRGDELEYRKMPGMRLVATGGLLDDTFWNRTWWMYSFVWPGFHYAVQAPKSGQLLVFDDHDTYTVKHYTTRNLHSPMLFPGNGYLLFADSNDNEPLFYRGKGEPRPLEWEVWYPPVERPEINLFGDAAHDKGPGFSRAQPARWTSWVDVRIEAMVLANDKLFFAGTPDLVPDDDPLAALEGRMGGVIKVVSARDGNQLAEYIMESAPVFDGLVAARERLLMTTRESEIICLGKESH